jgi:hypothetical protein
MFVCLFVVFIRLSKKVQLIMFPFFFEFRYSPLSPADFFAAAATASYLPAAAAAAASATTLSPSAGKFLTRFSSSSNL